MLDWKWQSKGKRLYFPFTSARTAMFLKSGKYNLKRKSWRTHVCMKISASPRSTNLHTPQCPQRLLCFWLCILVTASSLYSGPLAPCLNVHCKHSALLNRCAGASHRIYSNQASKAPWGRFSPSTQQLPLWHVQIFNKAQHRTYWSLLKIWTRMLSWFILRFHKLTSQRFGSSIIRRKSYKRAT